MDESEKLETPERETPPVESGPLTQAEPPGIVWAVMAILLVSSVAIYIRAVGPGYEFLHLDDGAYVEKNPVVQQGFTWEGVAWAFSPQTNVSGNWHPVTMLTHMIDCDLHGVVDASVEQGDAGITGLGPRGHHLTNILLHGLNVALLFWVLYRMTGAVWACALAAALFGLHPLRVESVAWISERKDVLSTLFWMLTMLAYVNYVQRGSRLSYAMALFWLAVGLLSKPMLVTLPCVLLLMDYWPLNRLAGPGDLEPGFWRQGGFWKTAGRLVLEKVPMFVLVAISCYVTMHSQSHGGAVVDFRAIPLMDRVANAACSYLLYPWMMMAPHDLAIVYPPYIEAVPQWLRIAAMAGLVASLVIAALAFRRAPYVFVGWLWYLGTLFPVIGLVFQVGVQAYADRYTYVPGIGIAIIVGWGLKDLIAWAPRFKMPAVVVSAGVLAVFAALTVHQVGRWKDTKTICEYTLSVTEKNGLVSLSLGSYYQDEGDPQAAVKYFARGAEYMPKSAAAHHFHGAALMESGDFEEAIPEFRRAIKLKFYESWESYTGLAHCLFKLERYDEAARASQQAILLCREARQKELTKAYRVMGFALVKQGRAAEAAKVLEALLALEPQFLTEALLLARIYSAHEDEQIRKPARAVELAEYVMRHRSDTQTLDTLAIAHAAQGNFPRAVDLTHEAAAQANQAASKYAISDPEKSDQFRVIARDLERRLILYQNRRPYREDPARFIN
jgi:tetratricopeptide (TPR) repeat protein